MSCRPKRRKDDEGEDEQHLEQAVLVHVADYRRGFPASVKVRVDYFDLAI